MGDAILFSTSSTGGGGSADMHITLVVVVVEGWLPVAGTDVVVVMGRYFGLVSAHFCVTSNFQMDSTLCCPNF